MAEQVCLAVASANFSQDGFCSEMGLGIHRSFDLISTLYKIKNPEIHDFI